MFHYIFQGLGVQGSGFASIALGKNSISDTRLNIWSDIAGSLPVGPQQCTGNAQGFSMFEGQLIVMPDLQVS